MAKHTARSTEPTVAPIPHSWSVKNWPADVWPHDARRGAWLARSRRNELLEAGALIRPGRELVVLGAPYARFLQRQAEGVQNFKTNLPAAADPRAA